LKPTRTVDFFKFRGNKQRISEFGAGKVPDFYVTTILEVLAMVNTGDSST
jgi:hypothetical protein